MTTVRTIQPAQTADPAAEYDPMLPLPYPWHIASNGDVERQDFWKGSPARLVGFQRDNVHRVVLRAEDWMAGEPDAAVGLQPVFVDLDGSMWADARPVTEVTEVVAAVDG